VHITAPSVAGQLKYVCVILIGVANVLARYTF